MTHQTDIEAPTFYEQIMTLRHQLESLRAENAELLETLQGIAEADWRKWEELASPEEFVRWAKARANHMVSKYAPHQEVKEQG